MRLLLSSVHRLRSWRLGTAAGTSCHPIRVAIFQAQRQYYSNNKSTSNIVLETVSADLRNSVSMFEAARDRFPAAWRFQRWYLTVVAALVASGKPRVVGELYSFLINQPEYSTSDQRKYLVRRIREALVRCCILNGVPTVMEATASIAAVEREEDRDYSFLRESWQSGEVNRKRATDTLDVLYQDDLPKILSKFDAHRDIRFMIVDIEYGLCLTEASVLSLFETELVVLPAVMCQNLIGPTLWHLRCSLRVGVSKDDVELIHQAIEIVARFAGRELASIGRVDDVEDEMHDRMP